MNTTNTPPTEPHFIYHDNEWYLMGDDDQFSPISAHNYSVTVTINDVYSHTFHFKGDDVKCIFGLHNSNPYPEIYSLVVEPAFLSDGEQVSFDEPYYIKVFIDETWSNIRFMLERERDYY